MGGLGGDRLTVFGLAATAVLAGDGLVAGGGRGGSGIVEDGHGGAGGGVDAEIG